jgi:hypothetical protein
MAHGPRPTAWASSMERASISSSAKNQPAALLRWTERGGGRAPGAGCCPRQVPAGRGWLRGSGWHCGRPPAALRPGAHRAAGGRSPRCVLEGKTSCTVRRHHVWGAGVAGRPSRLPPAPALSRTARQARPCADTGGCRQMQPDGRGCTRMHADGRGCAWGRLGASVQRSRCRTRGAALMRPPLCVVFACICIPPIRRSRPATGLRRPAAPAAMVAPRATSARQPPGSASSPGRSNGRAEMEAKTCPM